MIKFFTIALLFILNTNSFSCSIVIDNELKNKFFDDPSVSSGVFSGYVKKGIFSDEFIVERSWTSVKKSFAIDYRECGGFPKGDKLAYGEKFFVIQINDKNYGNSFRLNPYDAIIIKLSDATKFIDKLAEKSRIAKDEMNPSWQYCKDDKDCTEESGSCGEVVGVNKKYKIQFKNYLENAKASQFCLFSKFINNQKDANKCIRNFCGH